MKRGIEEKNFEELFAGEFYVVPIYQRNYSWDEYNLSVLWEDIISIRDRRMNASHVSEADHFMSSILVKDTPNDKRHIVDGQQRLTTMFLFLQASLTVLQENSGIMDSVSHEVLYENIQDVLYGKTREVSPETGRETGKRVFKSRLTIENQPANSSFSVLISKDNGTGYKDWNAGHKNSKIGVNFEFFRKRLTAILRGDNGMELFEETIMAVLGNIRLIYIPIQEKEAPQKIFESVNGLTKKLYAAELIKNYILMSISDEQTANSVYQKYWAIFDDPSWSGTDNDKAFLTKLFYYWICSKGIALKANDESVYRGFKSHANFNNAKSIDEVTKKAEAISVDINRSFLRVQKFESNKNVPSNRLEQMYSTLFTSKDALNSKIVFMRLLNIIDNLEDKFKVELNEKQMDSLVSVIESYIIRKTVSPKQYSQSTTGSILSAITFSSWSLENSGSIDDAISAFTLNFASHLVKSESKTAKWESNDDLRDHIAGNLPKGILPMQIEAGRHLHAKLLLMQVERHFQSSNPFYSKASPILGDYSVEHWMPQNSKSHDWKMKDPALKSIYVNSLGNLAVIPQSINSSLSNRSLPDKAGVISKHLSAIGETRTGLKTLDWIVDECINTTPLTWDEAKIERRSTWLFGVLFKEIFKDWEHFADPKCEDASIIIGDVEIEGSFYVKSGLFLPTAFHNVPLTVGEEHTPTEGILELRSRILTEGSVNEDDSKVSWEEPDVSLQKPVIWATAAVGYPAEFDLILK